MELLKTQKNAVFKILNEQNLPLNKFKWGSYHSPTFGQMSNLIYDNGEFFFTFEIRTHNSFIFEYSPGKSARIVRNNTTEWSIVLPVVRRWASYLKEEINAPDLWEQYKNYQASFSLTPSNEVLNEYFSVGEFEKINEALCSLESKINEQFELNEQQQESLHLKVDYLIGQAKHQRRREWTYMSVGVLVNIAVDLALDPEKWKILMTLFNTVISPIVPLISSTH